MAMGLPKELAEAVRRIRKAGLLVGAPSQSAQKIDVADPQTRKRIARFAKTPRNPGAERARLARKLRKAGYEVNGLTDRF